MSYIYFTSDTHYGHANILSYCHRPFKDIEHMNFSLIKNFNMRVKSDDIVFFVGDFCFRNSKGGKEGEGLTIKADYYRNQLNGHHVFIKGNHDSHNSLNTPIEGCLIHHSGKSIWICHKPEDAEDFVDLNICGHVHTKWKFNKTGNGTPIINCGVDQWNFMPVRIDEILKELEKWLNLK